MPRSHAKTSKHKNLYRGISQPLVVREQRVRASRHGKPQTRRKGMLDRGAMVPPGTEGARRSVEPKRPGVAYPAGTVEKDGLVVVYRKPRVVYAGPQVPVTEPYEMLVAEAPTATWGKRNTTDSMAPRGQKVSKTK